MKFIIVDPDFEEAEQLKKSLLSELQERDEFDESEIRHYASAEEAQDAFADKRDVCIITEIDLPNKNGLEFAEEIRKAGNHTQLVFFTKTNDYAMQCYDLDLTYYLLKPVSDKSIRLMLKRVRTKLEEDDC